MANMQDVKKRFVSFLATRTLKYQIDQAAKERGTTSSVLINETLDHEFGHIELTEENKEKIKEEIKKAKKRREYL